MDSDTTGGSGRPSPAPAPTMAQAGGHANGDVLRPRRHPRQLVPSRRATESISRALRINGGLDHKAFALMVVDTAGAVRTFTHPAVLARQEARIFPQSMRHAFAQTVARHIDHADSASVGDTTLPLAIHDVTSRRVIDASRKRASSMAMVDLGARPTKRQRQQLLDQPTQPTPLDPESEPDDAPEPVQMYVQLTIGNDAAVKELYESRFQQLQQLGCKIVAKAWIKRIHPRKQTKHPYRGGLPKAPPWWPEGIKHREPDHLLKPERIHLLITILRVGSVKIEELEESTNELQQPVIVNRRPLLAEIYRVAKEEARYRRGEIDADTQVPVAPNAKALLQSSPANQLEDLDDVDADSDEEAGLWDAVVCPDSSSIYDAMLREADETGSGHHRDPADDEQVKKEGNGLAYDVGDLMMPTTTQINVPVAALGTVANMSKACDDPGLTSSALIAMPPRCAQGPSTSYDIGHSAPGFTAPPPSHHHHHPPPRPRPHEFEVNGDLRVVPEASGIHIRRAQSLHPNLTPPGYGVWPPPPSPFDDGPASAGMYDNFISQPMAVPSQPQATVPTEALIPPRSNEHLWLAQIPAQTHLQAQARAQLGGAGLMQSLDANSLMHAGLLGISRSASGTPLAPTRFANADGTHFFYDNINVTRQRIPPSMSTAPRRTSDVVDTFDEVKEERGE